MKREATRSSIRCPRADEHKSEANIHLLVDQNGDHFCAVHGDVEVAAIRKTPGIAETVYVQGAWTGLVEPDVFGAILEAAFVGLEGLGEMTPAQEKAFEIARAAL